MFKKLDNHNSCVPHVPHGVQQRYAVQKWSNNAFYGKKLNANLEILYIKYICFTLHRK